MIPDPVSIKKVLVLYVGGAIGMKKNEDSVYVPSPNKFLETLRSSPEMHDTSLAETYIGNLTANQLVLPKVSNDVILYELKEYSPLLDSSNMSPTDWTKIAKDIEKNYKHFEGFVILQGTDTLTYTSSALSFMLEGLRKPVILTGSQIPIFEPRNDAKSNIISSLTFAGSYNIPEVCVFFANKLLRGCRTIKISSTHFSAFDSLSYMPLAEVGVEITLNTPYIMKARKIPFLVHKELNSKVGLLRFFPTLTSEMIRAFLQNSSFDGLVIESYGAGNIPSNQREMHEVIEEAVRKGTLIVNVSQCPQGFVSSTYETGEELLNIGVIPGYDMTGEAALTKLSYVLGIRGLTRNERVELMQKNIRGELTENGD